MMNRFKIGCLFVFSIFATYDLLAQSDYILTGSREYGVLDRLQIKLQKDSLLNFSAVKPYTRENVVRKLERVKELEAQGKVALSEADKYNIELLLKQSFEYRKEFGDKDTTLFLNDVFSRKAYDHPAYVGAKRGNFSIYSTWHIDYSRGKDDNLSNKLYNNIRALSIRGNLTKGIGYYSYVFEHQESNPLYVRRFTNKFNAVPGEGFYNNFKEDGYDLFNARGGIMFKAAKGIDLQFAYDKIFIGDGHRSLILSDFSNNFLFLKANARIWKFNYQMLLCQLVTTHSIANPDPGGVSSNYQYPKKYMAFHHIDIHATKWLQLGAYENVMFGRDNGFDLNYANPLIFYRAMERQLGSPDKVTIGLNFKANAFKRAQVYGQFVLNEFNIEEIRRYKNGSYVNKQAYQLGAKVVDLFGAKNLDLQVETNVVRPFTYTHYDTVGSYTHYNQPLAHPLGANFKEYIVILSYQPFKKLQLQAKLLTYKQGLDSAGYNFGSNIFRYYSTGRPPVSATNGAQRGDGFQIGSGSLTKCAYASFTASYEVLPNFFLDAQLINRTFEQAGFQNFDSRIYKLGLRLNIQRRDFEF